MATQARSAYGAALRLGDGVPGTALTVNGATNATPIVLQTTAAHGIVDVGYGTVAGVVGNLAANGTWIVERVDATHLKLRGSVGNGAYVSGGTFTPNSTYTTIAEVRNIAPAGFTAELADVSSHDGAGWGVSIPIIKRGKAMTVDLNFVPSDPGQDKLTGAIAIGLALTERPWMVVYPGTPRAALFFNGWVDSETVNAPIGPLAAQLTIAIDGAMVWQPS
jgi:hypothetical protein